MRIGIILRNFFEKSEVTTRAGYFHALGGNPLATGSVTDKGSRVKH